MKKLFTSHYDIAGNSIYRAIKLGMLNKVFPVGNFGGGPRLRPAFTLFILHYFGKPVFWFGVRFERHLHRIHQRIKNRK